MCHRAFSFLCGLLAPLPCARLSGQPSYDDPPINYSATTPDNPVSTLSRNLSSLKTSLTFDPSHGYLKSLLERLDIPDSSQTLVFSKTSLQRNRISPRTPRAIYFNDHTYVGWCQNGELIEIATADPNLGTAFYTLDNRPPKSSKVNEALLTRQSESCLQCHASSMTRNVPAPLVRSVYTDLAGQPILRAGTHLTTHQSPLSERWGGWYVSGQHGKQTHMGNSLWEDSDNADPELASDNPSQNLSTLSDHFNTKPYLTPHSDIVALMVLEHQVHFHRLLADASFKTRAALHDQQAIDQALGRKSAGHSDSTKSRIQSAVDPLLKCLLFSEEVPLTAHIAGTSGFKGHFESLGPRDAQDRSLRDFDLHTRMFRFPCSYLIYSDAFDALPKPVLDYLYPRLHQILTNQDQSKDFSHLSPTDRQAILQILSQTKKNLPPHWRD